MFVLTAFGAGLLPAGIVGCDSSPKTHLAGPSLSPADLGLPESDLPSTGFLVVGQDPSTGRFPAALAVAKLRRIEGEDGSADWRPESLKEEEAVRWNSLLDTLPAIREVVVLNERTAGPSDHGLPGIAATARRIGAGICLVYGTASTGPDSCELIGALVDTRDAHVLARVQALATSADFETRRPDAPHGDRRHEDPQYLAADKFRQQVRRCVIELVERDSPAALQANPGNSGSQATETP